LTKVNQKQVTRVKKSDVFTILAAILNLQVQDMLKTQDQQIYDTSNPLLYRNKDEEIVFVNYDDLQKFSVKFNSFRDNYNKQADLRAANVESLKQSYAETQTASLAQGLETELSKIRGNKKADARMPQAKVASPTKHKQSPSRDWKQTAPQANLAGRDVSAQDQQKTAANVRPRKRTTSSRRNGRSSPGKREPASATGNSDALGEDLSLIGSDAA